MQTHASIILACVHHVVTYMYVHPVSVDIDLLLCWKCSNEEMDLDSISIHITINKSIDTLWLECLLLEDMIGYVNSSIICLNCC